VAELVRRHGADAVERAGWLWRDKATGALGLERFARAGHRLSIPWRAPDGTIQSVQRRRLDAGEPKYIFPRGRPARFPHGIERLASAGPDTPVAFCEGALDAMALRLLALRKSEDMLVLGLPGLDGWRAGWAKLAAGREALIALDSDAAAERKCPSIAADLHEAGAARVVRLTPKSPSKDWAEVLERGAQ